MRSMVRRQCNLHDDVGLACLRAWMSPGWVIASTNLEVRAIAATTITVKSIVEYSILRYKCIYSGASAPLIKMLVDETSVDCCWRSCRLSSAHDDGILGQRGRFSGLADPRSPGSLCSPLFFSQVWPHIYSTALISIQNPMMSCSSCILSSGDYTCPPGYYPKLQLHIFRT